MGNDWLPKLAIYGDLGFEDNWSLPYLKEDVKNDLYDAIFHVGDIAYDLDAVNIVFSVNLKLKLII